MAIPLTGDTEGRQITFIDKGVIISVHEIEKVTDFSNIPGRPLITIGQRNFEPQICISVNVITDGGWKKEIKIFGEYVKDQVTGQIKGWLTKGNQVQQFFQVLFGSEAFIEDDFSIPKILLEKAIGKKYKRVQYCSGLYNGKPSYKDWQKVFPEDMPNELITDNWLAAKGWIITKKNDPYTPDIFAQWLEEKDKKNSSFNPEDFGSKPAEDSDPW